ncbi:sensor histidine kinase [Geodermatophilus sp. SYSU D00815]
MTVRPVDRGRQEREGGAVEERTALLTPPRSRRAVSWWTTLAEGYPTGAGRALPSTRRVVARFAAANLVAVAALLLGSVLASQQAAEREALTDARQRTDTIAALVVDSTVEPLLQGPPAPATVAQLDEVLGAPLAELGVVRVKIWTRDGTVVYSDEERLIGSVFPLGTEELAVLDEGGTRADVSDLNREENRFERAPSGKLLEVYRAIGPEDRPLGLETYWSYDVVSERQKEILWRFAPISVAVLLTFLLVQAPLAHRMVRQLRAGQRERELLQQRALDASVEERRRIAGSLHDGIVQDVSASALLVAQAADRLGRRGDRDAAGVLASAAVALRESVGSLRSLLVEIYPPHLDVAGLPAALADLADRLRSRGVDVRLRLAEPLDVPLETATLVFRVAQEALVNVAKHAGASSVDVTLSAPPGRLVLDITDDGSGFDLPSVRARGRSGHLGLTVLTDLAVAAGARLDLRTAPGAGTRLRLEVERR